MTKLSAFTFATLTFTQTNAFAPSNSALLHTSIVSETVPKINQWRLFAESEDTDKVSASEATLERLEKSLGKRTGKSKRGKSKGGVTKKASSPDKAAASLAPEEVFFEGPPSITETLLPTASILTVVGIIPAAASWSRQLWVRYKITSRRIRVTSGVGGKEMSEIVYPDIVELRTVKRLLGDGDMVAFLRDGAKFEMRNIPNFDETLDFILKQVDADVSKAYRKEGDVTRPKEPES